MASFSRWSPLLFALGLFIGGGGIAFSAQERPSHTSRKQPPLVGANAELRDVSIIETRGGQKLWELRADKVEVFEEKARVLVRKLLKPVQVAFHAEAGTVFALADEVLVNSDTKDVVLKGNVRVTSDKGASLMTESLAWSGGKKKFFTDQRVVLKKGEMVSRGIGLEGEEGLERVRLLAHVESEVRMMSKARGSTGWKPRGRAGGKR